MKKSRIILMIICLLLFIPSFAYADTGPKPSVKIKIKNPPDEDYVLDILEEQNHPEDNGKTQYTTDISDGIWQKLYAYSDGAWMSASIYNFLCHNSLHESKAGAKETFEYTYMPPNEFRVIVITKSGNVTVSDTVAKKSFYYTCTYDYSKNRITSSVFMQTSTLIILVSFIITLGITFVIEFVIFLLFRLKCRKKALKILAVNSITQVILYTVMLVYYEFTDYPNYLLIFAIAEIMVIIAEIFIYLKILKENSKKRVIAYTIIANLFSGPLFDTALFLILIFT